MKLSWSKPGVLMVKLVGFFRPVRRGSLRGDIGAEIGWAPSIPAEVAGC